jgi:hypothetical protein
VTLLLVVGGCVCSLWILGSESRSGRCHIEK